MVISKFKSPSLDGVLKVINDVHYVQVIVKISPTFLYTNTCFTDIPLSERLLTILHMDASQSKYTDGRAMDK